MKPKHKQSAKDAGYFVWVFNNGPEIMVLAIAPDEKFDLHVFAIVVNMIQIQVLYTYR